jgi:hypothetical protein
MQWRIIILSTITAMGTILHASTIKVTNKTDGIIKLSIQFTTPPMGWIPHVLDQHHFIDPGNKMSYDTEAICPTLIQVKSIKGTAEGQIALYKPDMENCYDTTSLTAVLQDGSLLVKADYIYAE